MSDVQEIRRLRAVTLVTVNFASAQYNYMREVEPKLKLLERYEEEFSVCTRCDRIFPNDYCEMLYPKCTSCGVEHELCSTCWIDLEYDDCRSCPNHQYNLYEDMHKYAWYCEDCIVPSNCPHCDAPMPVA